MRTQLLDAEQQIKYTAKQRIVFEILVVLGVMLLVKDIADRLNVIGAGSMAMWCGIFCATCFMKNQDIRWKEYGLSIPHGAGSWLKSVGLALLTVVLVILFMLTVVPTLSELLGVSTPESATDRFEFFLGRPLVFVAYLVTVIWIGAALGEELLMRGFLLNSLIRLFGDQNTGVAAAVFLHALVFGMLHISQGIPGVISTGIVAVIFAVIYLLNSRRLFPLILAHGLVNSISIVAYYVSDGTIT